MKVYFWNHVVRVVPYAHTYFIIPSSTTSYGFESCPTRECSVLVYKLYLHFNNVPSNEPFLTYAQIVEWSKSVNNGHILKSISSFLSYLHDLGIISIIGDFNPDSFNKSFSSSPISIVKDPSAWDQTFYKSSRIFSTPLSSLQPGHLNIVGLPICSIKDSFGTEVSPSIIRGLLVEPFFSSSYHPTQSDYPGYNNLKLPIVSDFGDIIPLDSPSLISKRLSDMLSPIISSCYIGSSTKLIFIGGDHSITPITTKALFSDDPYTIVHLDAHSDFFFANTSDYLHSNPINHLFGNTPNVTVYSFGLRTGADLRPSSFKKPTHNNDSYSRVSIWELKKMIRDNVDFQTLYPPRGNVYLSVDLDIIDPLFFPWTSTPSSGGLSIDEFFVLFDMLVSTYTPCAMDVVEFNCTKKMLDYDMLKDFFLMLIIKFCSSR